MPNEKNSGPVADIVAPILKFIKTESFGGIVLLIAAVAAIILANSGFASAYHHLWEEKLSLNFGNIGISFNLHFFINDILMVIFFFVVGLEIKRELLVGELSSFKKASFPAIAALGGILVPALIYFVINYSRGGILSGWAIPSATDIAFTLGIIALLGKRVPFSLKIFIIALAIVDDLAAVIIIAFFYTSGLSLISLLYAGIFTALLIGANRFKLNSGFIYVLLGAGVWYFLLKAGIHPTIAGVITAMSIPATTKSNPGLFLERISKAIKEYKESLTIKESILTSSKRQTYLFTIENGAVESLPLLLRFEHALLPYVNYFIMPIFAFANAGVTLGGGNGSFTDPVFLGIIFGLVLGKPIGIFLFSLGAVKAKITEFPGGTSLSKVFAVSIFGGIGFTMSIFISNLAFPNLNESLSTAKLAILIGSFSAAILGIIANLLIKNTKPSSDSVY